MRDTPPEASSPVSPPDTSWTMRSQVNKRAARLNKIETYFSKPQSVILLLLGVVLTISTFIPVVSIMQDTIAIHPDIIDTRLTGRTEGYTVVNYINLFTSSLAQANLWVPLFNTLLLAVLTCIISIVYSGFFAFLVARTNLRFKRYLSSIFIFPYIMPQWTLSAVWHSVFYSNKVTDTSNGLLASLFGVHAPQWWCQGLVPGSIVLSLHYAPFAYILIGGISKNMDSNLGKAATILDTPRWKTMSRIILPMIRPAILSTTLLVFDSAMGSYPVPHYLNLATLVTKYISLNSKYTGQASVLAIVMMLFGVAILLVNNHAMKGRKNYTTVTGKSGQLSKASLSKIGSWLIGVVLLAVTFFTSIFPILSFALETLLPNPGDYSFLYTMNPAYLATRWWLTNENITENGMYGQHGILYNNTIWLAFWGTLLVALSCMLIAGTISTLVGYAVPKNCRSRWTDYVNGVAFLPHLVSSIAVGAVLFVLFSTERLNLFNTYWLSTTAGVIKYIPFASRASLNSMLQLSNEIKEVATIQNIAWHKWMFKIIVPTQKSSVISGYMLPFMTCLRELPLFLLLCTQGFILATTLDYSDEMGLYAFSSAINLILIVTILFLSTLVNRLAGVSLDNDVGGK